MRRKWGISVLLLTLLLTRLLKIRHNGSILYKSGDGGITWHAVGGIPTLPIKGPVYMGCNLFTDSGNANDIFVQQLLSSTASGQSQVNSLWRSRDGGTSWQQVNTPQPFKGWTELVVAGPQIVAVAANDGGNASSCNSSNSTNVASNQLDNLYVSDDGGVTWDQIGQSLFSKGLRISSYSLLGSPLMSIGTTIFVQTSCSGSETYWASTDGGVSWKNVLLPDSNISGMQFTRASNGKFYGIALESLRSMAQIGSSELLFSSDNGATWNPLPPLDTIPNTLPIMSIYDSIILPDGSVLVNDAHNIYVTHPQNSEPIWQQFASEGGSGLFEHGWEIASTHQGLVLWGQATDTSNTSDPFAQQLTYLSPLP